ncbi:MAG: type IV pilus twitching motility protein PilT [Candidatus Berkelbacteria bacterium]|nr:type IV pilus twitching motility protein PilT [Candidatus Berkelbacteria bacterium]
MTEKKSAEIASYLDFAVSNDASDVHISVGVTPMVRIDGKLTNIPNSPVITPDKARELISTFAPPEMMTTITQKREIDFSFGYKAMRFRANIYFQKGTMSASLRLIPKTIRTIKELGLPPILEKFTEHNQGFVILTGPTGSGKSTTLAAMIDKINTEKRKHIVTIEDPIEYVFEHKESLITQREVGSDTNSIARALRSSLREDPDVVLIGEMRDLETIEASLTLAETGHLVLATLHTNSAAQTADRIINVFPPHMQQQISSQLASVLLGVVSQRLIPKVAGGRVLACEIMLANNAIKSLIREGKTYQIPNVIQTSASEGMITLDKVLAELVSKGDISLEDALNYANDPKSFKMMVY